MVNDVQRRLALQFAESHGMTTEWGTAAASNQGFPVSPWRLDRARRESPPRARGGDRLPRTCTLLCSHHRKEETATAEFARQCSELKERDVPFSCLGITRKKSLNWSGAQTWPDLLCTSVAILISLIRLSKALEVRPRQAAGGASCYRSARCQVWSMPLSTLPALEVAAISETAAVSEVIGLSMLAMSKLPPSFCWKADAHTIKVDVLRTRGLAALPFCMRSLSVSARGLLQVRIQRFLPQRCGEDCRQQTIPAMCHRDY